MKKVVSLLVFVICAFVAFAQNDSTTTKPTTTAAKIKGVLLTKYPKDRFAIDLLGTNWIHNGDNGFKTKWYSRGINIYLYYDLQIKKSRVSFAPGVGIGFTNIYNNSKLDDTAASGAKFTPISDYASNVKINKVALMYIDVPLELRIRSNKDRLGNVWKVAIGFKAGVRVDAHTKLVTKTPKENIKLKYFPDFNLFRAGPTIRVGYSSFNITAYYGVLGVFKSGKGPVANEFAVGISFNGL